MTLPILRTSADARRYVQRAKEEQKTIAVVPTMGALHHGHQELIRTAAAHGEEVLVTIFVNPTQFGPGEDLEKYPRSFERDVQRASEAGATAIFSPERGEMYPEGEETRVVPGKLARGLCGATRPGEHFTGVLTVVVKLMNLFSPAVYVFGRKDFQQLRIIQRMTLDLFLPVTIVEHPIVRESDGLALSSRNAYLSPEQRVRALAIPRALARAHAMFSARAAPAKVIESVEGLLRKADLEIDYVELVSQTTLQPEPAGIWPESPLLALAAFCGETRLIDNLRLGVDPPPGEA